MATLPKGTTREIATFFSGAFDQFVTLVKRVKRIDKPGTKEESEKWEFFFRGENGQELPNLNFGRAEFYNFPGREPIFRVVGWKLDEKDTEGLAHREKNGPFNNYFLTTDLKLAHSVFEIRSVSTPFFSSEKRQFKFTTELAELLEFRGKKIHPRVFLDNSFKLTPGLEVFPEASNFQRTPIGPLAMVRDVENRMFHLKWDLTEAYPRDRYSVVGHFNPQGEAPAFEGNQAVWINSQGEVVRKRSMEASTE